MTKLFKQFVGSSCKCKNKLNKSTKLETNKHHLCDSSRITLIIYRKKKKSEKTLCK